MYIVPLIQLKLATIRKFEDQGRSDSIFFVTVLYTCNHGHGNGWNGLDEKIILASDVVSINDPSFQ